VSGYVSARFDLPNHGPPKKVLTIASSYRCGSTYVSQSLWSDGRFGAPFEYFNFEKHMEFMIARLGVDDNDEYIRKLMGLRTSSNQVFGVKAHYHHFEAMLAKSAVWREYLGRMHFVYVNRNDKIAQAVSMCKAIQTNAWVSFERAREAPLFYSRELIEQCLREVMSQTEGWWRWFRARNIRPYVVNYEEFVEDVTSHIERISVWFGVEGDIAKAVTIPLVEKQFDRINREWIDRFLSEAKRSDAEQGSRTVSIWHEH
jgi:LPS sulfotransferase NodH